MTGGQNSKNMKTKMLPKTSRKPMNHAQIFPQRLTRDPLPHPKQTTHLGVSQVPDPCRPLPKQPPDRPTYQVTPHQATVQQYSAPLLSTLNLNTHHTRQGSLHHGCPQASPVSDSLPDLPQAGDLLLRGGDRGLHPLYHLLSVAVTVLGATPPLHHQHLVAVVCSSDHQPQSNLNNQ